MIDIVIVNWNSGNFLSTCVQSILSCKSVELVRAVYIIDNNSHDDSLLNIPGNEIVHIIQNSTNVGFSRACNQGFKMCTAPYVLLLNPDTSLFSATLSDCLTFMNQHEEVDILGCTLLGDDHEITVTCARFPTALRMCFDAIGLSKIAPKLFTPASLMTDWDHRQSRFVDQVMGAFMFMRREIIARVGYFDERFFVYYEELDFSKRLDSFGGKSFYSSEIKAIHSGGGTTRDKKGFRLFLNLRSRLQFAKKHFSRTGFALVWLSTFFIEPVSRSIMLIIKRRSNEIKDVYEGYKMLVGLRKFPGMIEPE